MEEKYRHRILTIPNMLSLFRLLLIPVIIRLYTVEENALWTAAVLVLSGLTDVADGCIARKYHMISNLGKAFDPVADKLTQIAVLLCLVGRYPRMLLPLGVMIVKETTAGVLGLLVIRKTGAVEGARWHGKLTTVVLYSMMFLHLIWYRIPAALSWVLVGVCTGLALLSAILYGKENIRILSGKRKRENYEKREKKQWQKDM